MPRRSRATPGQPGPALTVGATPALETGARHRRSTPALDASRCRTLGRVPALVECVPNISEGRRAEVISRVAAAIASVPGVRLLDQTSDPDHNRSVFTFAGAPDDVLAAAHALADAALAEIDMRTHRGEHPRLGAVDVVPFVPFLNGPHLGGGDDELPSHPPNIQTVKVAGRYGTMNSTRRCQRRGVEGRDWG